MNLSLALAKWKFARRRNAFYRDLHGALTNGGAVMDFFEAQRLRLASRGDVQAELFALWLRRLETHRLSDALRGFVPAPDVHVLSVAEAEDNLPAGLWLLATAVDLDKRKAKILAREMAMPLLLLLMVGVEVGFLVPRIGAAQ